MAVIIFRLDKDLLEWFRRQRGYQTHVNPILRAYMNTNTPLPSGENNSALRAATGVHFIGAQASKAGKYDRHA